MISGAMITVMDGILPVYKPVGITSFDVIRAFKRAVHPTFKLGHAGTLDPFADGVMLLMLGKGTKQFDVLQQQPKTYLARAILGAKSDTLDVTGSIETISENQNPKVSLEQIKQTAEQFMGVIEQQIPDYSAAKINGQPRYKLARKGEVLPSKSKSVTIYSLEIVSIENNECVMRASCSSGTYIRQLSYDIFKKLGVESYLSTLTRESVGDYTIEKCCQIGDFSELKWQDKVVLL
jgi:tRNA pseudouridine55 synthase